jgi:adenine-specific DNA-methyltransferase
MKQAIQPLISPLRVPPTEGIKYAGSKLKILPSILELVAPLNIDTVLDGFSGSTRVAQAFARMGYETTANDCSVWSEILAKSYLLNTRMPVHYQTLIDHLNSLQGYEGWFSEFYGGTSENNADKRPFQLKNTKKLDAIRDEIDVLKLDDIERSVALTSLMLALDSVDNTLGHYAAYLSGWSRRSYNELQLKVPLLFPNHRTNKVIKCDIFEAVESRSFDLAYFDPPYGSNNEKMPPSRVRYNAYYHFWTTLLLNDKPEIFGKANRREDSRDGRSASVFEEFRKDDNGSFIAMQAIKRLIENTKARYILLSYSSGGRASREELFALMRSEGQLLHAIEIDYRKNVMSKMRWTHQWVGGEDKHLEYLFLMEKA